MAGFGYSQRQVQGMRQELALMPWMLQSIEILSLPSQELEGFLLEAIQENEALELGLAAAAGPPPAPARSSDASDRHAAWLESLSERSQGLAEHLEQELVLRGLEPELEAWVQHLIRHLDPHGSLSSSDEALLGAAEEQGLRRDAALLGRAIGVLQSFEPRGIGGRDVVETLLLQLDPDEPDYALLCRLIEEFLDELVKNKLPRVAKSLEIELDDLNHLLERLRQLELNPAGDWTDESTPTITPDATVVPKGAGFEVRINDSGLPPVEIDQGIQRLASDPAQPKRIQRYLRGKLERAHWLVDALAQRRRTLQRIVSATFRHQRAFLDRGPGHLVALQMTELAEELELHVSTISRGVAGKYVDTPWGILTLRYFFQSRAGSENSARHDVRDRVGAIIAAEDPAHPLSDDDIVSELVNDGLRLARRTVAKYRKELDLPSSYRRRRY